MNHNGHNDKSSARVLPPMPNFPPNWEEQLNEYEPIEEANHLDIGQLMPPSNDPLAISKSLVFPIIGIWELG